MTKKMIFAAAAALALSGCGLEAQQADELRSKAAAAVNERGVLEAVGSAVDRQAAEDLARGAVKDAVREAIPSKELGLVAAIVDEEALVNGLDRAVDGEALKGAARAAAERAGGQVDRER